ncbi:MAG: GntR family transcriptional regulator [Gemmatimonadaceae bacterium]
MTLPLEASSINVAIHGTLPERTYQQLRTMIVRGRVAPGVRIMEQEVALKFGVSRTPVREAIARLVQEGYLNPIGGRRRTEVAVAPLSGDGVRELWGMIGAIEGFAVRATSRLPPARRELLAIDLARLNDELRAASTARPRNFDRLFELQAAFHQRFVDETAGQHLLSVYAILRPQVQRYEWVYGTRLDAEYEPSATEHVRIISAIRSGDGEKARHAVETHWERAAIRTVAIIDGLDQHAAPRRKDKSRAAPHLRQR